MMRVLILAAGFLAGVSSVAFEASRPAGQSTGAARITATRFAQNPLITLRSSPTLGDNINGPTVIRVPSWIDRPLGRYYMYFAHHMGQHIRLAYADALTGPWKIYEPGVLPVRDTAFFRPQPDPPAVLENFYTHVASPEVYIDEGQKRVVLWFHGWFTNGEAFPPTPAAARDWSRERNYGQYTQVAESNDGLTFQVRPAINRTSYLRVFPHDGMLYGIARAGLLLRGKDPLGLFEAGANVFRGGPYAGRVRHVALLQRGQTMHVFFTGIGDTPERVLVAPMNLSGDWSSWTIGAPSELLQPEAPYECHDLPNVPSEAGDIKGPARQLRDPAIFEEDGRTFLFYSFCGEQGIAGAELTLSQ